MKRASALPCCAAAVALTLAGCSSRPVQAPVIERAPPAVTRPAAQPAADTRPETYTVKRGDTLFSIALDQGHDYKELAAWNKLDNANLIRPGQQLRLKPPTGVQEAPVAEERIRLVAVRLEAGRGVELAPQDVVDVVAGDLVRAAKGKRIARLGAAPAAHEARRHRGSRTPVRRLTSSISESHSSTTERIAVQNRGSRRAWNSSTETPCCSTHVK